MVSKTQFDLSIDIFHIFISILKPSTGRWKNGKKHKYKTVEVDSMRELVRQERMMVYDANDHKCSQCEYARQVSKIVRVFRAFNFQVPSLDDRIFDVESFAQLVWHRILA